MQNKVTGVILAGGLARRMNKQDKGLMMYNNKPMIDYAFEAMSQVADTVFISANRNQQIYAQLGCQVISDQTDTFEGPLAGILSAMAHTKTRFLLVMPCDCPLLKPQHLQALLSALTTPKKTIDIAVAFDGQRLHPVLLALKTSLQSSLQNYLQQGRRKIDSWLLQHALYQVDFSHEADIFFNVNTLSELQTLENNQKIKQPKNET